MEKLVFSQSDVMGKQMKTILTLILLSLSVIGLSQTTITDKSEKKIELQTVMIYRYLTSDSTTNPYAKGLLYSKTKFDKNGRKEWNENYSPILPGGLMDKVEYTYDLKGNVVKEIRSNTFGPTQRTVFTYYDNGKVKQDSAFILPDNYLYYANSYAYNKYGDIISYTYFDKERRYTTTSKYDYKFGEKNTVLSKSQKSSDGSYRIQTFDNNQRLIEEIFPSETEGREKVKVHYEYNSNGQIVHKKTTSKLYSDSTKFIYNKEGKINEEHSGQGKKQYVYLNGILSEIQTIDKNGRVTDILKYSYLYYDN